VGGVKIGGGEGGKDGVGRWNLDSREGSVGGGPKIILREGSFLIIRVGLGFFGDFTEGEIPPLPLPPIGEWESIRTDESGLKK